jgi:hypothetical protein
VRPSISRAAFAGGVTSGLTVAVAKSGSDGAVISHHLRTIDVRFGSRGDIPVHLIYVSYSESGLVSMIGMAHFPTVGSIAWLTRFSIFLFPSLGPLCTLLSNSWARAFCAFGTASINSASALLKPEAA